MSTTTEQRTATIAVENVRSEGRTLHGFAALYGAESRDLGGFTETIQAGAFRDVLANQPDVYLTFNHSPDKILARTTSGTLRLRDEERGLAFEADLGDGPTAQDVRDMVRRGDLTGASFRFIVAPDGERWDGERRTLTRIQELIDLSLATSPAYDGPTVELRSQPPKEETKMGEATPSVDGAAEPVDDNKQEEQRSVSASTLRVTERDQGGVESRSLYGKFQAAGWTPQTGVASIPWGEFESAAENRMLWGGESRSLGVGTVDLISQYQRLSAPLGYDQRWVYPAFQTVAVDAGVTSVNVLSQSARTLVAGGTAVRSIDAVTTKPAIGGTVSMTAVSMKQIASISSGIPNVYLENNNIESIISQDLRLSVNGGIDFHVNAAITASSGTQTLSTDPLVNVVRRSISLLWGLGYNPNVLLLSPANAETIDLMMSGGTAGWPGWYTYGAGQFGPPTVFGLQRRISKNVAGPVVVDSQAYGRLFAGPVSLQRFEEAAGASNSSLLRCELNAVFAVERSSAAVRIT